VTRDRKILITYDKFGGMGAPPKRALVSTHSQLAVQCVDNVLIHSLDGQIALILLGHFAPKEIMMTMYWDQGTEEWIPTSTELFLEDQYDELIPYEEVEEEEVTELEPSDDFGGSFPLSVEYGDQEPEYFYNDEGYGSNFDDF
jgi:hypothetical protein